MAQTTHLQRPGDEASRPPDHLSASDEDHRNANLDHERSTGPKAPFDVLSSRGWKPFYPPGPEPAVSSESPPAENPFNPHGGPSQSLPQQATPLISQQGVMSLEDMADPQKSLNIAATQDGLAPDDPRNPRGTPDYIIGGAPPPPPEAP